ncbi:MULTISPECIES: helix-turn-helix domain-containing protein [unclassified Beijerinckia]|uniref:helix-turn-helix domain-containing protein n=1 Tax=unclassified Beijerinckia TaxID=2638183 RepID=UPI00089B59D5|nr:MULTISPECIES: helix-turn-helix domain-containing protein [unclassified Beijerinckia]MDH7794953.1 AraC-like DNA-binding protein [Beijerinckia sp. GAS462]SEB81740.1 transcriptional regulator, AraC family [Beijerinckia sp. 28-YEA-48]
MAADEISLSTDMVEPSLRTDMCREISRPFFEATPYPGEARTPLEVSIRSRAIGALLIGPTTFSQQQYRRDRRTILQGGLDQYFLQLFVSGALEGDCNGRAISVEPGDICVFDLAHPFETQVRTGSTLSMVLPRALIDKATNGRNLHGLVLKADTPLTRFLADFIVTFSKLTDQDSADALAIEEAVTTLVATSLAQHAPTSHDPALAHILRHRLLNFIDANLSDPELSPALLMQRFQVSRAHLYRMFATEGGVATIIREKRLDAAFRELSLPGSRVQSISEIAHTFGFSSSTQFHRAFRARFAVTPNQARGQLPSGQSDPRLASVQNHFGAYARHLVVGRSDKPPADEG